MKAGSATKTKKRALLVLVLAVLSGGGCALPHLDVDESLASGGSAGADDPGTGGGPIGGEASGHSGGSGNPGNQGGSTSAAGRGGAATGGRVGSSDGGVAGANTNAGTAGSSDAGASGASTEAGTAGTSDGGASGANTNAGAAGSAEGGTAGAATVPDCLGNPLPIIASGRVSPDNCGCEMNGTWFWYSDDAGTTVTNQANSVPVSADSALCLSGSTIVDPNYDAWGAGVGIDFVANTGGLLGDPYDAAARGIGGFEITVEGLFPQGLRVNFISAEEGSAAQEGGVDPLAVLARPGTFRVMFADASVPVGWEAANAGATVDPARVIGMRIQAVGGSLAADFDFCVTSIVPIPADDDGSLGVRPVSFSALPIDATGAFSASGNPAGIQGQFDCVSDGISTSSCVQSQVPYRSGDGMCISGTTLDNDFDAWGALIGLQLASSSGVYNATAHHLRGFRFTLTGDTGGLPLQVNSVGVGYEVGYNLPFVDYSTLGRHVVELGSLRCYDQTAGGNPCVPFDPAELQRVQFQVVGGAWAGDYNVCLSDLEVMMDPPTASSLLVLPPDFGLSSVIGLDAAASAPMTGLEALLPSSP